MTNDFPKYYKGLLNLAKRPELAIWADFLENAAEHMREEHEKLKACQKDAKRKSS